LNADIRSALRRTSGANSLLEVCSFYGNVVHSAAARAFHKKKHVAAALRAALTRCVLNADTYSMKKNTTDICSMPFFLLPLECRYPLSF